MSQMKVHWGRCSTAALFLLGAAVYAAHPPMTQSDYEAAERRIAAQAKTDRQACRKLKDNHRDVCEAQAKGRAKAMRAELEARNTHDPEAERAAKEVTADANYQVAKAKCEAVKGRQRDTCLRQAKDARVAAIRQAKVEKVERLREMKADAADERKAAKAKS